MIRYLCVFLILVCNSSLAESHCENNIVQLDGNKSLVLKRNISKQVDVESVNIISIFSDRDWSVIYIETDVADNAFLFYPGNIYKGRFATLWSGAAGIAEEESLFQWAKDNAHGISDSLAHCFAWYSTHRRNERDTQK